MAEVLAELEDPRTRAVNEKHGDDHGVNLTTLRALAIGERLEVLKDYPTSAGCTSPFAPVWIAETVQRRGE
ncbi:hypothetical protein Stube_59600 [Streptomyces tubercidicus]|uniref:Uncharacterized protein n=1 Tax=Streptomyces tubercidicus TaxID=47759 RepID=A0A640V0R1_9ACTN|nr:hypothetical protein Stube_59600 [Streptomyces tubercidicus]